MRCVQSISRKFESPPANSHPMYLRLRHPSASPAQKGLLVQKYSPIFFIKQIVLACLAIHLVGESRRAHLL